MKSLTYVVSGRGDSGDKSITNQGYTVTGLGRLQ